MTRDYRTPPQKRDDDKGYCIAAAVTLVVAIFLLWMIGLRITIDPEPLPTAAQMEISSP